MVGSLTPNLLERLISKLELVTFRFFVKDTCPCTKASLLSNLWENNCTGFIDIPKVKNSKY